MQQCVLCFLQHKLFHVVICVHNSYHEVLVVSTEKIVRDTGYKTAILKALLDIFGLEALVCYYENSHAHSVVRY